MPAQSEVAELQDLFQRHGGTDQGYFVGHYPRFRATLDRFLTGWSLARGRRVLDIGAHWLHQAVLFQRAGFEVSAADLPVTFELPAVQSLAEAHGIRLCPVRDLEQPVEFGELADDSFDLVVFTEIIEHITFNPVAMWKEIYRVLRPGGRIIITTPNYYALGGRAWNMPRFLNRFGGGIEVLDVLRLRTYGHHWKEYSMRELIYYFCVLSPDFDTARVDHVEPFVEVAARRWRDRISRWLIRRVPLLRPNLHLEIEIREKRHGIVVEPSY